MYESSLLDDQCLTIKMSHLHRYQFLPTFLLHLDDVGFGMNKASLLPPGVLLQFPESLL